MNRPRVAIDGPGGAGKTSVARAVAAALGVDCLDTGAMYRAVAAVVLRRGLDPADGEAVTGVARGLDDGDLLEVEADRVRVDGVDVTEKIRGPEVTEAVSAVAANPAVRDVMVARQRSWAEQRDGCVMEGRDITTVVLTDADVKVYLTADAATRARRRSGESGANEDTVRAALSERDHRDSTRRHAPLPPPGGLAEKGIAVIDTTYSTVEEVVGTIMQMIEEST